MRARSTRLVVRVIRYAVAATCAASTVLLAEQSPPDPQQRLLLGTWHLNLAKSRYTPGPPPKSESRTYIVDPEGLKGTIRRIYADGRSEVIEYLANYDRVYPVTGAVEYDAVRLKKVDDYTSEAVLSHAGRVFGYARRVISNDRKTMTITFRRESQETLVSYVALFERMED
jgi:hypothetical protein